MNSRSPYAGAPESEGEERVEEKMAGAAGFEPTHGRIKTCCLTAWRRPCCDGQMLVLMQNPAAGKSDFAEDAVVRRGMGGNLTTFVTAAKLFFKEKRF